MLPRLKSSELTHRPLPSIFVQQCRHRHQTRHRMINVQLLSDVKNIGKLGTIQAVSPGHMRNNLYPQGKAGYIVKGVAPRLPPLVHRSGALSDEENTAKFENLQTRIEALTPIVFYRPLVSSLRSASPMSDEKPLPIYGSVTIHDVAARLRQNHNLSLVLPDALLSFDSQRYRDKIKSTGSATLFVKLRNGVTVSLKVLVEPEFNVQKKKFQ